MTTTTSTSCARCGRRATVQTRVGDLCRKHSDHLPPYLRRPPRPAKKKDTP